MSIELNLAQANRLATLPLDCICRPLPYKPGHTIASEKDLVLPQVHHPAFYGCFDWHSAVHGHWSLVYLLKLFPEMEAAQEAREKLNKNLTKENIQKELDYFFLSPYTKAFERTYGWAWFLKLQEELSGWEDPDGKRWFQNLQILADFFVESYQSFLPNLAYPIRTGQHSNTAFGISFAIDYAQTIQLDTFAELLKKEAIRLFYNDKNGPIDWEPGGYDFFSPCLMEMDLMRKVLSGSAFQSWLEQFLPSLYNHSLDLQPGQIKNRADGFLVHLDGLNFSRAWCMYPLLNNASAQIMADEHIKFSIDKITDGDYAGQHWLASFALYALKVKSERWQEIIN